MLMVILGAGASFDSAASKRLPDAEYDTETIKYRPPLAKDLFSDRPAFSDSLKRYGRMRGIVTQLRSAAPNKTIESVLQKLQSERDKNLERYNQLAAVRFYLRDMLRDCQESWLNLISRVTNYGTLVDAIQSEPKLPKPVCFVTFNYDTLLELAFSDAGIRFNHVNDYTQRGDFKVFKVHGSIDWGRQVENIEPFQGVFQDLIAREKMIDEAPRMKLTQSFVKSGNNVDSSNRPLFPAIAIPVESKSEFECPQDHVDCLVQLLPDTSKILVIGWRAMEMNFLELLGKFTRKPISAMAVCGPKDESVAALDRIGKHVQISDRLTTDGGFTDCVVNDLWQPFFAR